MSRKICPGSANGKQGWLYASFERVGCGRWYWWCCSFDDGVASEWVRSWVTRGIQPIEALLADWVRAEPIECKGRYPGEESRHRGPGWSGNRCGRLVSLNSSVDLLTVAKPRGACHRPRAIRGRLFAVKTRPGKPHTMCDGERVCRQLVSTSVEGGIVVVDQANP